MVVFPMEIGATGFAGVLRFLHDGRQSDEAVVDFVITKGAAVLSRISLEDINLTEEEFVGLEDIELYSAVREWMAHAKYRCIELRDDGKVFIWDSYPWITD